MRILKLRKRTRRAAGFTVLELLIVIIVLGILAGLMMPRFDGASSSATRAILVNSIRIGLVQQELFLAENGRFATGAELADYAGTNLGNFRPPQMAAKDTLYTSSGWDEGVGLYVEYFPESTVVGAAFEGRQDIICQYRRGVSAHGQRLEGQIFCFQFNEAGQMIANERDWGDKIRF